MQHGGALACGEHHGEPHRPLPQLAPASAMERRRTWRTRIWRPARAREAARGGRGGATGCRGATDHAGARRSTSFVCVLALRSRRASVLRRAKCCRPNNPTVGHPLADSDRPPPPLLLVRPHVIYSSPNPSALQRGLAPPPTQAASPTTQRGWRGRGGDGALRRPRRSAGPVSRARTGVRLRASGADAHLVPRGRVPSPPRCTRWLWRRRARSNPVVLRSGRASPPAWAAASRTQ